MLLDEEPVQTTVRMRWVDRWVDIEPSRLPLVARWIDNFVLAASEGIFGGKPTAFVDLFRVDNGKIAEHRYVMADIPAKMALGNGKF